MRDPSAGSPAPAPALAPSNGPISWISYWIMTPSIGSSSPSAIKAAKSNCSAASTTPMTDPTPLPVQKEDPRRSLEDDAGRHHPVHPVHPVSTPSAPIVAVHDLHVFYGRTHAVQGLSLTISRGQVYGFIGPNGAGKTTTIKVLATLLRPTFQRTRLKSQGMRRRPDPAAVRRKIGYMPDSFGVYDDLTAAEYLHFFAAAYRIPDCRNSAPGASSCAMCSRSPTSRKKRTRPWMGSRAG